MIGKYIQYGFMTIRDCPVGKEKDELLLKLKDFHNPSDNYLENGYRFTDEQLEFARQTGNAVMLPLDCMADFIPLHLKEKVDADDDLIKRDIVGLIKSRDLFYLFQQMKTVYTGLCAYAALNSKDEDVVDSALRFLQLYHKWYIFALGNDGDEIDEMIDAHEKWLKSLN